MIRPSVDVSEIAKLQVPKFHDVCGFDMEIMTFVNDQSERSMLVYSCTISVAVQFGTELWVPLAFTFLYYMRPRASSTTSTVDS